VRWSVVGSGPYYVVSVNLGQGYVLKANPYYSQPNCAAAPGCYPAPGQYAQNVYVFWDQNSTEGVDEYIAGEADTANFFPSDTPTILNLVHQGRLGLLSEPTLQVSEWGFNFYLDPQFVRTVYNVPMNVPATFFANVGLREFLSQAFPFNYSLTRLDTQDGIIYDDNLGGVLPEGLGNYYPTNISWPGYNTTTGDWHDPASDPSAVGGAAWWWANITSVGSPYYDSFLANCTSESPCTWPIEVVVGESPPFDAAQVWSSEITTLSGGALAPTVVSCNFSYYGCSPAIYCFCNYTALTVSLHNWLPDYPDPTDYFEAYYYPDSVYTVEDNMGSALEFYYDCSIYTLSPSGAFATDFAALAHWAAQELVPQACQGTAFQVMDWALNVAARDADPAQRALLYNMVEHVGNALALYVSYVQPVMISSFATWDEASTITTNPAQSGQQWYLWE